MVKSVDISLPHLTIQASHCCVWCGFEPHTWHQTCQVLLAGVSGGQGASVFTPPVLLIGLSQMSCPMRKPDLCLCSSQRQRSASQLQSAPLLSLVQFLFFLNLKFQPSIHLLKLYRLVCVRLGRKSRRPVFSRGGSFKQKSS